VTYGRARRVPTTGLLRWHLDQLDSVRKVKEGETTNDLYAFLRAEPNAEVDAIHPKAMPVILTTPEEVETWMAAPPEEALKLPLPDGALRIVVRGVKEDPAPTT
jgi:putative SOS response-associated peptidase YedK